jgi:hypothetical protein
MHAMVVRHGCWKSRAGSADGNGFCWLRVIHWNIVKISLEEVEREKEGVTDKSSRIGQMLIGAESPRGWVAPDKSITNSRLKI